MSNWSLLFLVVALIAALFWFGFFDSAVVGGSLIVFAFAMVFFLATLVAHGIQRHELRARKGDGSTGGKCREEKRPPTADTEHNFGGRRESEPQAGTDAHSTRENTFSNVA